MSLQSKKSSSLSLPPLIGGIFLLSLIYWFYLSFSTSMNIVFDSIGFEALGKMIYSQGWITYFKTGPNREPLYPLLIAFSMNISHLTGIAYVKIMALLGVILLFTTQIFTYLILRLLKIRNSICGLILLYLCFSPALTNTAFSLFSEITTYPSILGAILTSFYIWEAIRLSKYQRALFYCVLLGVSLTLATMVKAVFEGIAPIYLFILFLSILITNKQTIVKRLLPFIICVLTATASFYVPVTSFKWLNYHYNGNFTFTNRASWMVYGNTVRRTEPLTLKKFSEDLANVPGAGICKGFFSQKECDYWASPESDGFGLDKLNELTNQHIPPAKINSTFLNLSLQKASQHPFQYTLMSCMEGFKMFFWEST